MIIVREHCSLLSDRRDSTYMLFQEEKILKRKRQGKPIISMLSEPGINPWEG